MDGPGEGAAIDETYRLVPLVTAIRWATTALGLLLVSTGQPGVAEAIMGAAVLSYSLWRTLRPLDVSGRSPSALWAVAIEGIVMVTAVVLSGYWGSPFVFGLVAAIAAAGFTGGVPLAICAASACFVAVAVPYHLDTDQATIDLSVQWAGELVLVAILAGYVRHLSLHARDSTSRYAGRLQQLSDVNDLLLQLRRAAQTLPMSLDLAETLDSSARRLRELFEPDVFIVVVRDDEQWSVARTNGVMLAGQMSTADLPEVLRQPLDSPTAGVLATLDDDLPGLAPTSRSGLYICLSARDELIGMVGVERGTGEPFGARHVELMEAFAQQVGFAIDNARWFSRIGNLAAEQERNRIARDLHDRMGQELALVGFELDRVARSASSEGLRLQLLDLRESIRSVVRELRETLYDLRSDVSEDADLATALAQFLERVSQRSGLEVDFRHESRHRLSLTVEREVWRIAQEAVFNVERHAEARSLTVRWKTDESGAQLSVIDDGNGITRGRRQSDGYGILGMQERADAIAATLSITSLPGRGTTVQLIVPALAVVPRS